MKLIKKTERLRGKLAGHKICGSVFSTTYVRNSSCSDKQQVTFESGGAHVGFHVKYPLFLPDLHQNWNVSTDFIKIPKYRIS
jgi:hypothetical protein